MYMHIIESTYILYTLFYVVYKLLYLHSINTYYLVRNGVVILSGKKILGRNHGAISRVKKEKLHNRVALTFFDIAVVISLIYKSYIIFISPVRGWVIQVIVI
jgi:hypothetical protein